MEQHESLLTFSDPGPAAGHGIGIRGGAFRGLVAFGEEDAQRLTANLDNYDDVDGDLLVLENPVPDEIPLILSVGGLLAARGGSTSHAAVAVHGIEDRPYSAVLGVSELHVSGGSATLTRPGEQTAHTVHAGDVLSIHGQTGDVYIGTRDILGIAAEPAGDHGTPESTVTA